MKYKIGDKVKIGIRFPLSCDRGKLCIVTEIKAAQNSFDYDVKEKDKCWSCPVREYELENAVAKGEQLLLFEL